MSDKKEREEPPFQANPASMNGVPDLSQLVYLEMKNVLFNCEWRYCKMERKHCYTSVSTILVAINPYERLQIYGQDVINEFHEHQKQGRMPTNRPHPYCVSARSYMRMVQRKQNQSVIVCGESGAGKTETTKLLMRYLAMTAPSASMESSMVEQQIIAASPILEAYGNAKTVMNNNSSRFGKFTKLLYDVPEKAREGHILGSYMETYLLEKSRVVFQSPNERNYHIPYFLYKGLPKEKHDEFGIVDPKVFYYANQGGATEVPGINDISRYEELSESLRLMRIDEGIQADLWAITMGIFNLGNVQFKAQGDGFASIDPKAQKNMDELARLWAVDAKAVTKRLTTANMKVMKKNIEKKIPFSDAATNRDSIAKGIYENIFLYLCERINAELYQTDEEDLKSILYIGILDVFGFENFWINSMEQFCINYTNEKLQQFFNYHIIRSEQEEYIRESVFWTPLTVPDNLEYINFVEDKDYGFFKILDSACNAPKPSAEAFMQDLFKRHGKNPCIKKISKPGSGNARGGPVGKKKKKKKGKSSERYDGFQIKHFADTVAYDISKFLVKNMEAVHPDTAKMMKKSKTVLVKEIGGQTSKSKKKKSVTAVFAGGIRTLMKNLSSTEPYFVRCVNPNMQKSSTIWTEKVVEHQLRCGGLVEALKVLKLGYPTRVPYSTLYDAYHGNTTNPLLKNMGEQTFSSALLIAFDVEEQDYELGLTKIFFKPAKAAVLDTIMSASGQPLSTDQNAKITKWVVAKRVQQMMGSARSFLFLRRQVRLTRAEARWRYSGRIAGILGGSVINHLVMARKNILERKRLAGAQAMQSFFRGTFTRSKYLKRLSKVMKATKIIWTSYRRWQERIELQRWLDIKVEETRKRKEEQRRKEEERLRQLKIEEERARIAEEKRIAALKEEERKAEEELQKERARQERQKKLEEERLRKEKEAAEEAERLEAERKKQEEEAEQRRLEKERKAEEERKRQEEQEAKLEQERLDNLKRQEQTSIRVREQKKHEEREQHEERRAKRDEKVRKTKRSRRKAEEKRRAEEDDRIMRERFPEMLRHDEESETESDSEYSDSEEEEAVSLKEQLKNFEKTAATGQLFLKYTGKRRRKPQDRIVKVSFDNKYRAKQISWGSGSRHIDFSEIMYISWGHWTPVFEARKDQLKKDLCFSVVGKQQILDVQAQSKEMAELWVKGLRKLIGHSDEESDKLAEKGLRSGNLPGHNRHRDQSESKRAEREHKKRTKSLMLLQQDLFVMTTTTVFRNLEEERIWDIDQGVRERFNAKALYELALREDIPWRQWNHWVREKIVTFLRENNRIAPHQGQYQMGYGHQQMASQGAPNGMQFQMGGQMGGYGQPQPVQGQYGNINHAQRNSFAQMGYGHPPPQQQQQSPMSPQFQGSPMQIPALPAQPMNTNWNAPPNALHKGQTQGQGQAQGEECQLM